METEVRIRCRSKQTYERIEGSSFSRYQRLLTFPNGYQLSVLSGSGFYCDFDAPYEVAILNKENKIVRVEGISSPYDSVMGWLTKPQWLRIAVKVAQLEPLP